MNITDLISELEQLAEEHGEDTEVRLAIQPSYPFEHGIAEVVASTLGGPECPHCDGPVEENRPGEFSCTNCEAEGMEADDLDDDGEPSQVIVYIGEGGQVGYLPGCARSDLGWGR